MKSIYLISLLFVFTLSSCFKKEKVDTIIHNAKIHTMTDWLEEQDAIAIKDGKIVEVGAERQILNKYKADNIIDAGKADVYPGFTDAHGHLFSYARQRLSVNLVDCKSKEEIIQRIKKYQKKYQRSFIIGRGWNQELWGEEMPTNDFLNKAFPNTPACLYRIDGHAILANHQMISLCDNQNLQQTIEGGKIIFNDKKQPTGIFIDNAMNLIAEILPDFPEKELKQEIIEIQKELLSKGITGVHEAGITHKEFKVLNELVNDKKLIINVYAMLLPTKINFDFVKQNGHYKNKNLYIRSFKVFGDGALGSRGALLKKAYADAPAHHGFLVTPIKKIQEIADFCLTHDYQMNTHAIGDSTNQIILNLYQKVFEQKPDHRWRIEHAQVIDPKDFILFSQAGVFPSIQPTHATSDQRWAEKRLGKARMKGAYAYRTLQEHFGMLAIGTDFPVESINPFLTIHAAVQRKDKNNFPSIGFQKEEALKLNDCIKGMTIWAAFASFQENQLGSLEKGKDATLSIFEYPVMSHKKFKDNFAKIVMIKGKIVHQY